jgi:hypothetical protein
VLGGVFDPVARRITESRTVGPWLTDYRLLMSDSKSDGASRVVT